MLIYFKYVHKKFNNNIEKVKTTLMPKWLVCYVFQKIKIYNGSNKAHNYGFISNNYKIWIYF